MKKSKIIVPALAVLLLSTAASVTGTVAWFSANKKVTASGISVEAQTSGNLYIAAATVQGTGDSQSFSDAPGIGSMGLTEVTFASTNLVGSSSLNPASTAADSITPTFCYMEETSKAKVATGGAIYNTDAGSSEMALFSNKTFSATNLAATKDVAVVGKVYIGLPSSATGGSLSCMVDITAKDSKKNGLLKCVRTAVIVPETSGCSVKVYSSDADATTRPILYSSSKYSVSTTTLTSYNESKELTTMTAGGVKEALIFTWFEGQDGDCLNSNALSTDEYNIELTFTLA